MQGEKSPKPAVQIVKVDNKLNVTTAKGSVVKTSQNVKTSENTKKKIDEDSKGKDDANTLMNCIKNCAYYESCVGKKEARFREIGQELSKLSDEKDKLNDEEKKLCEKIQDLEAQSPNFSLMEFRDFSFLKYSLNKKVMEKLEISRQVSLLRLERNKVTKAMGEVANLYKSFVYQREELLRKHMIRKVNK